MNNSKNAPGGLAAGGANALRLFRDYEGNDYALLTEYVEDEEDIDEEDIDEDEPEEVYIMQIVPVGDDQEEFVPVDEDLAETLLAIFEARDFDEFEMDDEV